MALVHDPLSQASSGGASVVGNTYAGFLESGCKVLKGVLSISGHQTLYYRGAHYVAPAGGAVIMGYIIKSSGVSSFSLEHSTAGCDASAAAPAGAVGIISETAGSAVFDGASAAETIQGLLSSLCPGGKYLSYSSGSAVVSRITLFVKEL